MKIGGFILSFLALGLLANAQQDNILQAADQPGIVNIETEPGINRISNLQLEWNRLRGHTCSGYRIEIFFGKSRDEAKKIMKEFKEERDSIPCNLEFDNPYLRVRVGNFRNRVEAQKLYYELKKEFDTVILIKVDNMAYPPIY